jgi:zinc transport system substrate-binding protein
MAIFAFGAAPAHAEPRVVATIKPIHSLLVRMMEGVGTPALLVKGSASPHSYAMRPSDAREINSAEVFFRVSPAIETFTGKIISDLPKSVRVVTLAEAHGIKLLDRREGDTFEAHDHGSADDAGHDHEHEDHDEHEAHEAHEDHDEHEEGASRDGHVWLDTENAKVMVEAMVRVLVEIAPEHAEKLKANTVKLLADLDALDAEIRESLKPVAGKPFVVFHDAYQYFERRFELKAVGSITVSPEVQPSAKRLSQIRAKLAGLSAACVFAEPHFSPGLVANVIEGTKARSGILDPEGTMVTEGVNAYFDIMRGLASGMKSCLTQGS